MPRNAPNLKYGPLLLVVAFVISALTLYGGAQLVGTGGSEAAGDEGAGDTGGAAAGPVSVRIVAKDLKYDPRTIRANAGSDVNVSLDNQDPGVIHNIAFYTNNRATEKIFGSPLTTGPAVENLRFTAPSSPGSYYFRCDVHPDTMTGAFIVR